MDAQDSAFTELPSPNSGHIPSSVTIPPNKGSKNYTMDEVFQVWYENKDQILNSISSFPVQQREIYKSTEPNQIYHLDLQHSSTDPKLGNPIAKHIEPKNETLVDNESQANNKGEEAFSTPSNNDAISNGFSNLSVNDEIQDTERFKSSQGPPPGMNSRPQDLDSSNSLNIPQVPLLNSSQIEWLYLDPSGNEQGPFNGDMMQEWLSDGYLNLDLQIKRQQEIQYRTLKELCDTVQNYIQPFKVPLPDLSALNSNGVTNLQPQFEDPTHSLHNQHHQQLQAQQAIKPQPLQFKHQPQFHQFMSNPTGNLGAAGMRLNSSMNSQTNLFGNDFIGQQDPFTSTPLTPNGGFSNTNQFGIDNVNSGGIGGFSQPLSNSLHMPSLLQQQIQNQNQPVLSRANSGWGLDTTGGLMGSSPSTPVSVAPQLSSQISQPAPLSPWISAAQSLSRVNSPFIPSSTLSNAEHSGSNNNNVDDHVLDQIHSSVVTDILSDGDDDKFTHNVKEGNRYNDNQQQSLSPIHQQQQQQQQQPSSPAQQEQAQQHQPSSKTEEALVTDVSKAEQESPLIEQTRFTDSTTASPSIENLKPAALPQQKLAPWASATSSINQDTKSKPTLTLKEIQQLEAEKLAKQKEELKVEQAAIAAAAAKAWSVEEKQTTAEKPSLPKTSSWATNSTIKPVIAKKSLAEIQKEEAEAKAKTRAASIAASNPSSTSVPISNSKPSFASAAANASLNDSAWTTVASKKPQVKKQTVSQPSITNNVSSAAKTNPQLLRSVSASKPIASNVNSGLIREDFLIWARSSMTNLYPTVSKDDLLDIFTTLPSNGSDSSQLIAETIYSSSATMDGRRFAQEFLKRRQKVEQQVGQSDDVSWASAIISSADKVSTVDEDGWSTSVKPKKKGRKH